MIDHLDITLVANAGVLVRGNGTGILVDGIHDEEGHPFSHVSAASLMAMRMGLKPFLNLDYLLFTHEHPDHFTPALVLEQVQHRPAKGLFVPKRSKGSDALGQLLDHAGKADIKCHESSLEPGEFCRVSLTDDLTITVIGTEHMGPQYKGFLSDCFLISLGGMNLLFTGDSDYVAEYYEAAVSGVALDAVFVNPIFHHNPEGQAIIHDLLRPRNVIIYHMPYAHEDAMNFHYMVKRDREKYARDGVQTHVLCEEKQRLRLDAEKKDETATVARSGA